MKSDDGHGINLDDLGGGLTQHNSSENNYLGKLNAVLHFQDTGDAELTLSLSENNNINNIDKKNSSKNKPNVYNGASD